MVRKLVDSGQDFDLILSFERCGNGGLEMCVFCYEYDLYIWVVAKAAFHDLI